jgi:hypothetical protein
MIAPAETTYDVSESSSNSVGALFRCGSNNEKLVRVRIDWRCTTPMVFLIGRTNFSGRSVAVWRAIFVGRSDDAFGDQLLSGEPFLLGEAPCHGHSLALANHGTCEGLRGTLNSIITNELSAATKGHIVTSNLSQRYLSLFDLMMSSCLCQSLPC